MTKKNITIIALTGALVLAMTAMAFAGPGWGRGAGCATEAAYANLTPEKRAEVDAVYEKFQAKFSELRKEMWTKHATLQAMVNGGDADEKKIAQLAGDITDAKDAMWSLRKDMADEVTEITGILPSDCPVGGQAGCAAYGGGRGWGGGQKY